MDAQQALSDLTEISSQIRAAVIFDDKGKVAGSTLDAGRAEELARNAAELLALAEGVKTGNSTELTQLEAATEEGSVFVVREGTTRIAATTGVDPTVGLVFYDLKSALRNLETKPEPKRRATTRKTSTTPTAKAAAKKPAAKKTTTTARKPTTPRKKKDAP